MPSSCHIAPGKSQGQCGTLTLYLLNTLLLYSKGAHMRAIRQGDVWFVEAAPVPGGGTVGNEI